MSKSTLLNLRWSAMQLGPGTGPVRERGVVLIVVLLVLVVMALAAGALVRSVDVANLAAGNLSFKQSTLSATDIGVEAAVAQFRTGSHFAFELNTREAQASRAYYATIQPSDARGIPSVLLNLSTYDAAHSAGCFWATPGWAGGRVPCTSAEPASSMGQVRYVVDRQCIIEGPYNNETCNVVGSGSTAPGGSDPTLHTGLEDSPLYRVTVRVDGPKNTVSYAQVVYRP